MMLQTLISQALSVLTRKKSENPEHILNIPLRLRISLIFQSVKPDSIPNNRKLVHKSYFFIFSYNVLLLNPRMVAASRLFG